MYLEVTIQGANPTLSYTEVDTYTDDLGYVDITECNDNTTSITFSVEINGGGGSYTDTRLKFQTNGTITAITGKGSTDDNDDDVRIGISTTNNNYFDLQSNSWITVPSNYYSSSSFYVILNSKWGSDIDSYMYLKVTIKGTNPTLTYTEIDTYTDDLGYVKITQ